MMMFLDSMDWSEIIVVLLGQTGLIAIALGWFFKIYLKRMDLNHEIEKIKIQTQGEAFKDDLATMDVMHDAMDGIIDKYKANIVLHIKIANGEVFADKTHKWKYSAILQSGGYGGSQSLRNNLQRRLVSECPKLFSRLESDGFAFNPSISSDTSNALESRILMFGYSSYMIVATDDCLNAFLLCWNTSDIGASGVDLNAKLAKLIRSELTSIEDILNSKK